MDLKTRIEAELKQAMRAGNTIARDTLRMILSDLKKRDIELGRELSPDEEQSVLQRAVKMRQESISQFDQAGRADLVAKERSELAVIQVYLPEVFGEEETRAALSAIVAELGLSSRKDLGAAMKAAMARHKGRIDGRLAQKILGEILK